MSATPPAAATWTGVALVALLLLAGIACFVIGQKDSGTSLVSLAAGIVLGGGGLHVANKITES